MSRPHPFRLLVIEDEDRLRHLVTLFLRGEGYDVVEAADGDQGVDVFLEHRSFDLVLLDLNLPRRTGLEVCRAIRIAAPHQPVLICSAAIMSDHEAELRSLGVAGFLGKPYHPEALRALVVRLVDHPPPSQVAAAG